LGSAQLLSDSLGRPAKPENRRPKTETNPKSESRTSPPLLLAHLSVMLWQGMADWGGSDFGFRVSTLFWFSGVGFRISRGRPLSLQESQLRPGWRQALTL
jgi:hypothetical protein